MEGRLNINLDESFTSNDVIAICGNVKCNQEKSAWFVPREFVEDTLNLKEYNVNKHIVIMSCCSHCFANYFIKAVKQPIVEFKISEYNLIKKPLSK